MRFLFCLLSLVFAVSVHARELSDLRTFGDISTTTMYLFTSPSCPHCRDFHKIIFPELLKRYVNTKKAQIVIVDMPYDTVTMNAVMLMRCLPPEKSEKLMNWLYENQSKWYTKNARAVIQQYANALGMKTQQMDECINNDQLRSDIEDQRNNLSALYGIHGWPTLALRHGNSVKFYSGTSRRSILNGIEIDMKALQDSHTSMSS